MSEYLQLRFDRELKHEQIKLIRGQIMLLHHDITERQRSIEQLIELTNKLQAEAQELADKMLEIEYKNGL
jgi:hypothetical protein